MELMGLVWIHPCSVTLRPVFHLRINSREIFREWKIALWLDFHYAEFSARTKFSLYLQLSICPRGKFHLMDIRLKARFPLGANCPARDCFIFLSGSRVEPNKENC